LFLIFAIDVRAGSPPAATTAPSDSTVDWLLSQRSPAATRPSAASTQPTTSPLVSHGDDEGNAREGTIELSDGTSIRGRIATTAEKPVRVWVEAEKQYEDIPFSLIKTIEASVVWERDEREWRFKASGSDVKEYSGKTYPARETSYKITLSDGQTVEGGVVAPLFVTDGEGNSKTYVLHKRDKGEVGQTLGQLVYVKRVSLP
jgi:hypothetical protein